MGSYISQFTVRFVPLSGALCCAKQQRVQVHFQIEVFGPQESEPRAEDRELDLRPIRDDLPAPTPCQAAPGDTKLCGLNHTPGQREPRSLRLFKLRLT
jgi:hypothetical protein